MSFAHIRHLYGNQFSHAHAMKSMWSGLSEKATFDSGQGGIENAVYGAVLYNSVNMNNNLLGMLPTMDETGQISSVDGEQAISFRVAHSPPTVDDVNEGGSVPTAQTYSVEEVESTPKRSPMVFEESILHSIRSRLQDGVSFDRLTDLGQSYLMRSVERDALGRKLTGVSDSYSADNNVVPLDRVVSSQTEVDNDGGLSDGDEDVYDITRSGSTTWANAQVSDNGGSDQQLTSSVVNDHIDTQIQNSSAEKENLVIATGYDSARVLSDLREAQFRADALQAPNREDVNDAETRLGANFNASISHWDSIPVVVSESVPSDTLSRIFVMDPTPAQTPGEEGPKPKIGVEEYLNPYVERSGLDEQQGFLATGEFKNKVLFLMYHEVVCRDFPAQGKITNLTE